MTRTFTSLLKAARRALGAALASLRRRPAYLLAALIGAAVLLVILVSPRQDSRQDSKTAAQSTETGMAVNLTATAQAEANVQAKIDLSRQLAAQTYSLKDSQFDLALLLGIEANRASPTNEAFASLLDLIESRPELVKILQPGEAGTTALGFSPDGSTLALGRSDGSITLLNAYDGKLIRRLAPESSGDEIRALVFHPSSQILASATCTSRDKSGICIQNVITLWNLAKGTVITVQKTDFGDPVNMEFNQIGDRILFGFRNNGGGFVLLDADSLKPVTQAVDIGIEGSGIASVVLSPDGSKVAVCADKVEQLLIYAVSNPQTALEPTRIPIPISRHDSGQAHKTYTGTTTLFWDVKQQIPVSPVPGCYGSSRVANAVSDDGSLVLSFYPAVGLLQPSPMDQKSIYFHNPVDNTAVGSPLTGDHGDISLFAYSPRDHHLAFVSSSGKLFLWDLLRKQPLGSGLDEYDLNVVTISPDGETLYAGNRSGEILRWDAATLQTIPPALQGGTESMESLAVSPDNSILAAGDDAGSIYLWDTRSGARLDTTLTLTNPVRDLIFTPDGKQLIALISENSNGGVLHFIDIQTWQEDASLAISSKGGGVALSPDGRFLATAGDHLKVYDLKSNNQFQQLEKEIDRVAFIDDHTLTAVNGQSILFWDLDTNKTSEHRIDLPTNRVRAIAYDSSRQLLAISDWEGAISLWDASNGQQIGPSLINLPFRENPVHQFKELYPVLSMTFSANGMRLFTAGNGELRVWNLDLNTLSRAACEIANRNLTMQEWRTYFGEEPYRETCPGLSN